MLKLQRDNAILKDNAVKLETAVVQKAIITKQKEDFEEILGANKKMNELVSNLKKDLDDLDNRFNKDGSETSTRLQLRRQTQSTELLTR